MHYICYRFQDIHSESDSEDEGKSLKPVSCIGLQPGSDIFVLGPDIHFYCNGKSIPPEDQKYKFIPFILNQLGVMQISAPVYALPEVGGDPLFQVVRGIQRLGGENSMCGLFCLGECCIPCTLIVYPEPHNSNLWWPHACNFAKK